MSWRNSGTRWQNIKDLDMFKEAEMRALLEDPTASYDDVWDNHDGTIEVVYGSTPGVLMLRNTGYDAASIFAHGYCAILALALHDRSNLPLTLFTSPTEDGHWSGHAAVTVDDGKVLDITGIRTAEAVRSAYRNVNTVETVTREDFINRVFAPEHRGNPYGFVDPLEAWITHDFADYLITEHAPQHA